MSWLSKLLKFNSIYMENLRTPVRLLRGNNQIVRRFSPRISNTTQRSASEQAAAAAEECCGPCINEYVVDLSHGYDTDTLCWPGECDFKICTDEMKYDCGTITSQEFTIGEHCGTHINAPYSFLQSGDRVDCIDINKFFVNGVFLDMCNTVNNDPYFEMDRAPMVRWEERNGPMPPNSVLLISFGWSYRWPSRTSYLGPGGIETFRFPHLTMDAAEWIINKKTIIGLAVDTASPDAGDSKCFPIHRALLEKGIYILENVNVIRPLPAVFDMTLLPMNLKGGAAAPVRIVARFVL